MKELKDKFIEILSKEKGYFGNVYTFGLVKKEYEFIGYELTEDILPILNEMSEKQLKTFKHIIVYFEFHALSLKKMLISRIKSDFESLCNEMSWSHFMTVIMFGILEIATKDKYGKIKNHEKKIKIKQFFNENLEEELKNEAVKNYRVNKISNDSKEFKDFSDVFDNLWHKVRSGFIHDASLDFIGTEWIEFEGLNQIEVKNNFPIQDFLKLTFQAILNSYGYKGKIKLSEYNR